MLQNPFDIVDEIPEVARGREYSDMSENRKESALARNPLEIGAADRIRTRDVQLGKLAFCH